MYYLAYSTINNSLVALSDRDIPTRELIVVETRDGDIPDLNKWAWNPSVLDWHERTDGRLLASIDFMQRFADAELVAIYTAARQVVAIEVWLEKFRTVDVVNLDSAATIDGVQALEAAGLLAAGRAAEILL